MAREKKLKLRLKGTKDLILHNGRLANPFDPYTQKLAAISKKKNKTLDDHAQMAHLEARAGLYETPDGLVGFPAMNIWKCLHEAAKGFKLGESIKSFVKLDPDMVFPILIKGKSVQCDKFLEDGKNMLMKSVKIQQKRIMRTRPVIHAPWVIEAEIVVQDGAIPDEKLLSAIQAMGAKGIGDWRPIYGTFSVEAA